MTHLYPSCPLAEAYPILLRVPPDDRAAYVRRAEAGEPPTPEQSAALGFHPSIVGGVLVPANRAMTPAQMAASFKGDEPAKRRLAQALHKAWKGKKSTRVEVASE